MTKTGHIKDIKGYWKRKKNLMQASAKKAAVQKSQSSTDPLTDPIEYSRGFFSNVRSLKLPRRRVLKKNWD